MAKYQNDLMLDAALAWVRDGISKQTVCSTQPTSYAEANSTYMLATVSITSTDLTIGDGDTNGRKVAIAAKNSVSISNSGTAAHLALISSSDSVLRYVTTVTTKALTSGDQVNIPTWDIEIADAA